MTFSQSNGAAAGVRGGGGMRGGDGVRAAGGAWDGDGVAAVGAEIGRTEADAGPVAGIEAAGRVTTGVEGGTTIGDGLTSDGVGAAATGAEGGTESAGAFAGSADVSAGVAPSGD